MQVFIVITAVIAGVMLAALAIEAWYDRTHPTSMGEPNEEDNPDA